MKEWIRSVSCKPIQELKAILRDKPYCKLLRQIVMKFEKWITGNKKWVGVFKIISRDYDGNELRVDYYWNTLVAEGEQAMLELFFSGLNAPAGFELGTFYGDVTRDSAYASLAGEPTDYGYSRVVLARDTTDWPTRINDADGYFYVSSKTATFSAVSGEWGPVDYLALVTTDPSPRLISYADITERTEEDGESFDVIYTVTFNPN